MKRLILLAILSANLSFGAIGRVNVAQASDMTGNPVATLATSSYSVTSSNLVAVGLSWFNTSPPPTTATITDTAGNVFTLIRSAQPDVNSKISIYYAKNVTGSGSDVITATITGTGLYVAMTVIQYSGLDTTAPADTSIGATAASGTTFTTGSFSTVAPDEVIVFVARNGGGIGLSYSAGVSYAIQVQDSGGVMAMEDKIVSSTFSGTASMDCTTSAGWLGVAATFSATPISAAGGSRTRVISQ